MLIQFYDVRHSIAPYTFHNILECRLYSDERKQRICNRIYMDAALSYNFRIKSLQELRNFTIFFLFEEPKKMRNAQIRV